VKRDQNDDRHEPEGDRLEHLSRPHETREQSGADEDQNGNETRKALEILGPHSEDRAGIVSEDEDQNDPGEAEQKDGQETRWPPLADRSGHDDRLPLAQRRIQEPAYRPAAEKLTGRRTLENR
jgi:hypothetical protein